MRRDCVSRYKLLLVDKNSYVSLSCYMTYWSMGNPKRVDSIYIFMKFHLDANFESVKTGYSFVLGHSEEIATYINECFRN